MNKVNNTLTTPAPTKSWGQLIKLTLPIAMGYYAAGIAYGVLAVNAGLPIWLTVALSIFVFSGAAQYAVIPLLTNSTGLVPIMLSTFLISLRHLFYALALHSDFPKKGIQRWYSAFSLTDENYALLAVQHKSERKSLIVNVNLLCQFYWVSASLIGALLGNQYANLIPHLDFALPCLFAILAYEQYSHSRQWFPLALATVSFLLAKTLFPDWTLLSAILFCALTILGRSYYQTR